MKRGATTNVHTQQLNGAPQWIAARGAGENPPCWALHRLGRAADHRYRHSTRTAETSTDLDLAAPSGVLGNQKTLALALAHRPGCLLRATSPARGTDFFLQATTIAAEKRRRRLGRAKIMLERPGEGQPVLLQ